MLIPYLIICFFTYIHLVTLCNWIPTKAKIIASITPILNLFVILFIDFGLIYIVIKQCIEDICKTNKN
jgi:hypothetical protein